MDAEITRSTSIVPDRSISFSPRTALAPWNSREAPGAAASPGPATRQAVHRALRHVIGLGRSAHDLLDVGCGEGVPSSHRLCPRRRAPRADISAPSVELAARRRPSSLRRGQCRPAPAVCGPRLRLRDLRSTPGERRRVPKAPEPGGLILVAVPGPDDLIELPPGCSGCKGREAARPAGYEELGKSLRLVSKPRCATPHLRPAVRDLLTVTYRGFRQSERVAVGL